MNVRCSYSSPSKEPVTVKKWSSVTVWGGPVGTTGQGSVPPPPRSQTQESPLSESGLTQVRAETCSGVRFVLSRHSHATPRVVPVRGRVPSYPARGREDPGQHARRDKATRDSTTAPARHRGWSPRGGTQTTGPREDTDPRGDTARP